MKHFNNVINDIVIRCTYRIKGNFFKLKPCITYTSVKSLYTKNEMLMQMKIYPEFLKLNIDIKTLTQNSWIDQVKFTCLSE